MRMNDRVGTRVLGFWGVILGVACVLRGSWRFVDKSLFAVSVVLHSKLEDPLFVSQLSHIFQTSQ